MGSGETMALGKEVERVGCGVAASQRLGRERAKAIAAWLGTVEPIARLNVDCFNNGEVGPTSHSRKPSAVQDMNKATATKIRANVAMDPVVQQSA
jgi:hypothetical protein